MREMSYALKQKFEENARNPAYKLYAYKRTDSFSSIVAGTNTVPPLDITPYCSDISWNLATLSFTLKDPSTLFHPDEGIYPDYIGDKCVIRLKEGDDFVDEDLWMWTFTGRIQGQLGWVTSRKGRQRESKVTVYSRENTSSWKKRKISTHEYTLGTDVGIMLRDILTIFMELTPEEIRIPAILGRNFYHKVNQISQSTPWDSISDILQVVTQVPAFDGEGRIYSWSKNMYRNPDLKLPDWVKVSSYEITAKQEEYVNKITVTYLDANLEKIEAPFQVLGTANITTGFFTPQERLDCYWSDDRKQRAQDTMMKVIKSINDNLLPIGNEEYEEHNEFHGRITVTVDIWVPILATALLIAYATSGWWVDLVVTVPLVGTGTTIPVGKYAQSLVLIGILAIMMSLGSAQYEIWGTPYDMAYLEKQTICIEEGIEYWEENEKEIKNDFIGIHQWADAIAITELVYEKSKCKPRKLVMSDYLGLEIGDIIQLPDGRLFFIEGLQKQIKRGTPTNLEVLGFKVMGY